MGDGAPPLEVTMADTDPAAAPRIPLIGEPAPGFKARTTQGPISFPADYKGKWVILFSHPADFTPVCTTEFMNFASMAEELRALNCELIASPSTPSMPTSPGCAPSRSGLSTRA
jgi:peroxiredoxin